MYAGSISGLTELARPAGVSIHIQWRQRGRERGKVKEKDKYKTLLLNLSSLSPTHFLNSPSLPSTIPCSLPPPPPSFSPLPLSLPTCKASTSRPPLTHCIEGLLPVGTAVPLQIGVGKESQCARLRKGAGRGHGTQRTDTYWVTVGDVETWCISTTRTYVHTQTTQQ